MIVFPHKTVEFKFLLKAFLAVCQLPPVFVRLWQSLAAIGVVLWLCSIIVVLAVYCVGKLRNDKLNSYFCEMFIFAKGFYGF